jgi:C4-dicarboxylate-specific signal transduction histidine kinase
MKPNKNNLLTKIENILQKENISMNELKKELFRECKKQLNRFDIVVKQSDSQQKELLKLNEQKDEFLKAQSKLATMGELIDSMGHQMKQPLNAISLVASQLDMTDELSLSEMKEMKNIIIERVDYLANTIDEFRTFLRPDKEKTLIYFDKLINSAEVLLKDNITHVSVTIEKSHDKNLKIFVIKNEFIHILINIINNAIDAFKENKIENRIIKIENEEDEKFHIIKISDNAGGIDKKFLPKIFEPNVTSKAQKGGSGMGLYMSKMIIEKIGGKIEAKNIENGVMIEIKVPKEK